MKKLLKLIGIVGALCIGLNSGAAVANTQTFSGWAPAGSGWGAVFGSPDVDGPFVDNYFFQMPTSLQVLGGAVVISGFGPNSSGSGVSFNTFFTDFELKDVTTNTVIGGGPLLSVFDTFSFVAGPGTDVYKLTVKGGLIPGHNLGSYSGTLNVSPVPEPETYAMLLAGLGLVGFMVRRRKENV